MPEYTKIDHECVECGHLNVHVLFLSMLWFMCIAFMLVAKNVREEIPAADAKHMWNLVDVRDEKALRIDQVKVVLGMTGVHFDDETLKERWTTDFHARDVGDRIRFSDFIAVHNKSAPSALAAIVVFFVQTFGLFTRGKLNTAINAESSEHCSE